MITDLNDLVGSAQMENLLCFALLPGVGGRRFRLEYFYMEFSAASSGETKMPLSVFFESVAGNRGQVVGCGLVRIE